MMSVGAVETVLPHRHPMLLVDWIIEVEPGHRLIAQKAVSATEACYSRVRAQSDDDAYAYPQTLMLESWCQAAAVLATWDDPTRPGDDRILVLGRITDVLFKHVVLPGDVLEHRVRLVQSGDGTAVVHGDCLIGDEVVMSVGLAVLARRSAAVLSATRNGSAPKA
jgi:3-hydroxyacyl-[acyl-carrier-protein] dehydratase